MKTIRIGDSIVGVGEPVFVIAEAGVNHNGDITLAKKLVDAAVYAGANAVKFQTFRAVDVTTKGASLVTYQKKDTRTGETQQELLKGLELSDDEFMELKDYCDLKKIIFLSTPHSFEAIDFLEPLVPCFKFGSGDLTNLPTLRHAAKKGKPIILGTGMGTIEEVEDTVRAIREEGNSHIIVLHCTTSYPCPIGDVNIKAMDSMRDALDCLTGFSDHTMGSVAGVMAVALGAAVIEKHLTLDHSLPGPDHMASAEPEVLKQFIKDIRDAERALGSGIKEPAASEREAIEKARKSLVAAVDIPEGSTITREMISIKRPGTGIKPGDLESVIGKRARQNIRRDELIKPEWLY